MLNFSPTDCNSLILQVPMDFIFTR